jgi:hypothetical protein
LYGWSSRASNAALTWPALIAIAALVAAIATLTKAVSHHGLDNMTLQIVAAGTAFMLCGAGWWAMPTPRF